MVASQICFNENYEGENESASARKSVSKKMAGVGLMYLCLLIYIIFFQKQFFFQNLFEIRNRKYNPVNLAKHRFLGQQNYVIIIKRIFSKGDIQKVRLPKIPEILPPLPACSLLFVFEQPPLPPPAQGTPQFLYL